MNSEQRKEAWKEIKGNYKMPFKTFLGKDIFIDLSECEYILAVTEKQFVIIMNDKCFMVFGSLKYEWCDSNRTKLISQSILQNEKLTYLEEKALAFLK